jgi:hypothetical protein
MISLEALHENSTSYAPPTQPLMTTNKKNIYHLIELAFISLQIVQQSQQVFN